MSGTQGAPAGATAAEDPALAELRQAYAEGDLVVFVGAGISAAAGLPNWKKLVELLCEHAMARRADPAALQEILDLVASRQLIDALSALKGVLGGDEFCSIIERYLDDRDKDIPEAARVIAGLSTGIRAIITTNLDHLLERALNGRWPALARATPDIARRRGYILKLHGTLLDRTTWVFTREEYDRAMYADPVLKTTFSALFHACPLLFVGYGLSDADFDVLLGQVRALTGDQSLRHYALVPREMATPHRTKLLEDSGLRLIPYENPDGRHARLIEILRSLAVPVPQGGAAPPLPAGPSAEGPRPVPKEPAVSAGQGAPQPLATPATSATPAKKKEEETSGNRPPRRWPLAAAAAAALVAVAGGGAWAWTRYQERLRQEEAARQKAQSEGRARELAREARERLGEEPEQSLRKLAEAWAQAPVPEVEDALLHWTLQRSRRVLRPKAPPAVAAFSPDGRHVATAGADKVTLWETEGPRSVELFMADSGFTTIAAAFSPDGKYLSTVSTSGTVLLWEIPSGKALGKLSLSGARAPAVVFSPDGRRIIATDAEKAWVWEPGAGQPVAVEPPPKSGRPIAPSPDGRRVLLAIPQGASAVWDVDGGKPPVALKGMKQPPERGVFSLDGQRLLTSSAGGPSQVWDLAGSGSPVDLGEPLASLKHVAFSPDGKQVLAAGDEAAGLWDAPRGHRLFSFKGHSAGITAVAFSADGQQALTASEDRTVRIWDTKSGLEILSLAHGAPVRHAAFSADGRRIVTSSALVARIWDTGAVAPLEVLEGHRSYIAWASFTPDGKRVATQGEDGARVWEPGLGKPPKVLGAGSAGVFMEAALGPGNLVALAGSRTSTWIWDAASEQAKLELPSGGVAVSGLAYSGDGKHVAGGTVGGSVWLWDAASGKGKRFATAHEGQVSSAVFSPDGSAFATAGADNLVRVWKVAGGAPEPVTLRGHGAGPTSVSFSADGRHVLTGSWDGTARLWEAATGSEVMMLRHGPGYVSASFGPGGKRIATSGRDGIARLWDAASGEEQAKLVGHGEGISSAVFSPDGKHVLTASNDRTARLWDAATGRFIQSLRGARKELIVAAFSPDGRRILTAGLDGVARVYTCGPCAPVAERFDAALASAGASCEERRKYLPALTCPPLP